MQYDTARICDLQLYIPWNYHERYPGEYTWDGMADVFSFIELIQELDMIVLLRVGPYICAEWDFGGLPWWLGSSQVTCSDICPNCVLTCGGLPWWLRSSQVTLAWRPDICHNLWPNLLGPALVARIISGYPCPNLCPNLCANFVSICGGLP